MKQSGYFRDPVGLLLATLVALSMLGVWMYVKQAPGIDYYVAWAAADAVKNDTPLNIYEPSSRYKLAVEYRNKADAQQDAPKQKQVAAYLKELQMTATPFMYWVTGMLSIGDYETDLRVWQILSLTLVTISVLLLCRLLEFTPATSLAILLPVLIWFMPFYSSLRVANVNAFQLGLISLILWLLRPNANVRYQFVAGLLIGMLVMFKPNLGPVAFLFGGGWAVRRQYSSLGVSILGMLSGALAAVLVSSIWMRSATIWLDWFNYIRQFVDGGPGEKGGNYAVITHIFSDTSPLGQAALAVFLCILCLALLAWGRRGAALPADSAADRKREFIENAILIALGCIVPLLSSTLVWLHYYLLTLPMIIVAYRPWQEPGPFKPVAFFMLRLLPTVALVVLMETALRDVIGVENRIYNEAVTSISALLLFVAGLWQFGHGVRVSSSA